MKNISKKPGFTLVEIVVALFIVSLGMIGVLSLINQNIQTQNINKNRFTASMLAQEGMELIRNKRDTNWKEGQPWYTGIEAGTYRVDYTGLIDGTIRDINDTTLQKIGSGNNAGFFAYSSSEPDSIFKRLVTISYPSIDKMKVISEAAWSERGKNFSYQVEGFLYDWR